MKRAARTGLLLFAGFLLSVFLWEGGGHSLIGIWSRIQREAIRLLAPSPQIALIHDASSRGPLRAAEYHELARILKTRGVWYKTDFQGSIYVHGRDLERIKKHLMGGRFHAPYPEGWELFTDRPHARPMKSFDRHANLHRARKGELEKTLSYFHFIRRARVLIAYPTRVYPPSTKGIQASITLHLAEGDKIPSRDQIRLIKKICTRLVPGLMPRSVFIMSASGEILDPAARGER